MIDVKQALQGVPHFDTFCSVRQLHELTERLRADPRFTVTVAGTSEGGIPIYHVRYGQGSVKALFLAFPHCMEPIGGLTVYSLMSLLLQRCATLVEADVEWHIVPCIDPDGALLNEVWTQNLSFDRFVKHYYMQTHREQADMSFPIAYKKLNWNQPSHGARILKSLLDKIRPDFFFDLHSTRAGGAFYFLTRDIGQDHRRQIYQLLREQNFPIQERPCWKEISTPFDEGMWEQYKTRKLYDYLEKTTAAPETSAILRYGACSWDYLEEIKPEALTLVAEMGIFRHADDESDEPTNMNLRRFKLRIDADSKYLASVLLSEWEKVKDDVERTNPFYRTVVGYALPAKEKVLEGGWPISRYPTAEMLSNPAHDRLMTRGDVFNTCVMDSGLYFVQFAYHLVNLLRASPQTAAVQEALERVERAFDEVQGEIARHINFDGFQAFELDTLARVQLGSGLIVLNSIVEADGRAAVRGEPPSPGS